MSIHDHSHDDKSPRGGFLTSRTGIALLAFLAIVGYFLWSEHEAHVRAVVPYLPYLLLLACPLLHLFMHGGHGDHEDHKQHRDERRAP